MKKLPKKYIIVEIIPTNSLASKGFIAQLQALKIENDKIIERMDLRFFDNLIKNNDLLNMISYDKDMFKYTDNLLDEFKAFIENIPLLIIDNAYTIDYLKEIDNEQVSVFDYLNMKCSNTVFDELMDKYKLEPSNHLVDLLYEALMFEKNR